MDKNTKGRYKFPYGDFEKVHRCGVLTADSRAGQCKHYDIENPAAHIARLIERKIAPHFDFERTTRLAVGKATRQATEEQKQALTE
jgi:ABC-type transporter MlaC component